MYEMFQAATKFNKPIGNWNVSNVKDINYMFIEAKSFNQNISNWKLDNVKYIYEIFYDCPIKEKYKPKIKY